MDAVARRDRARPPTGRLPENIMHFARVLREAGIPVGPGAVIDALDAAATGAMASRQDFYWMLHAVFVKRREHSALFEQAFHVFWRRPKMLEQMMQMLFQQIQVEALPKDKKAGMRRLAEAMFSGAETTSRRERPPGEMEIDAEYTTSLDEVLRKRDFEQMSAAEMHRARVAIARMRRDRFEVRTRRFRRSIHGHRIDMRRTLRDSLRAGGDVIDLARKEHRHREPPLVVLADISGSMSGYSRMFLHFLHALASDRSRMHVFLFGTRLTNITRALARRDVDEAMAKVSAQVEDWSGGTRIADCLKAFNFRWARRVLTQGAHVLLMTDGLERGDTDVLEAEMARLARAARRIVWLNPLLRYEGFEARAAGIRAIMPYVDEFRPVHNLESLEDLAAALAYSGRAGHDPRRWLAASPEPSEANP
jgi:uncharacterized protein